MLFLLVAAIIVSWPTMETTLHRTTHPLKFSEHVEKYSQEYEVDPLIIYSFIYTESNFDPAAESAVGARGLMQITEETFDWIKSKIASTEDITYDDMYIAETNIRFGTYFVSRSISKYGDLATASASYHSGWGTVDRLLDDPQYALNENTLSQYPYEQMNLYVYKIQKNYDIYLELDNENIKEK